MFEYGCALALGAMVGLGCAAGAQEQANNPGGGDGGFGNPGGNVGSGAGGGAQPIVSGCLRDCQDFPAQPLFDKTAGSTPPADAAHFFGKPDAFSGPGPCVLEPQLSVGNQPGALFPRNWLRPRFRWQTAGSETLWEIRLTAAAERNPLVAYTTRTTWAVPRDIWKALAANVVDAPITVTIRGVNPSAATQVSGTRGTFTIAPVEVRGKLVYWATTSSEVKPDTSKLVGFDVGDESVINALTIPEVGDRGILSAGGRDLRGKYDDPHGVPPGSVQCIGCHVSTPDGEAVSFTDHWPWNSVLASVQGASVGKRPSYLTKTAEVLMNQPWLGMQTFSLGHWAPGDRVVVSVYSPRNPNNGGTGFSDSPPYPSHKDGLAWIDLETSATFAAADPTKGDVQQQLNQQINGVQGKAFGLLALDGETRSAATPSFSHDGTRIVYTSADATQDGRLSGNNSEADLHVVPYGARKGGKVSPLAGAAEPHVAEYYPAFSADDVLVAFTRVATIDSAPLYYRPDGEVFVVPSKGGKATRLRANDPPACGAEHSPGVINSWPKWSPAVMSIDPSSSEFKGGQRAYYWLVFSSARAYEGRFQLPKTQYSPQDTRSSQLYMTGIVRHLDTGELETFPAVYLWNQDAATSNLTPAWDEFKIPPVPGPQ